MVGASRGLGKDTVGVSFSRPGLPSLGPEDAVSVVEATCSPSGVPAGRTTGVRLGQHDVHQDHWAARVDTHSWLLRQHFQPVRTHQLARLVPPRLCRRYTSASGCSSSRDHPRTPLNPRSSSLPCSARKVIGRPRYHCREFQPPLSADGSRPTPRSSSGREDRRWQEPGGSRAPTGTVCGRAPV